MNAEIKKSKKILAGIILVSISTLGYTQTKTITGKVVDDIGNAIENVKVFVTGSSDTVLTNVNGEYTIEVSSESLEIDYLMDEFKPASSSIGNQAKIDIVMVDEGSKVIYDISLIDLLNSNIPLSDQQSIVNYLKNCKELAIM